MSKWLLVLAVGLCVVGDVTAQKRQVTREEYEEYKRNPPKGSDGRPLWMSKLEEIIRTDSKENIWDYIITEEDVRPPTWSEWVVDKVWGKAEAKADAMIANASREGWFSGLWGKVTLVFWLVVGGLVAFIALCVMGTINRILGRGN